MKTLCILSLILAAATVTGAGRAEAQFVNSGITAGVDVNGFKPELGRRFCLDPRSRACAESNRAKPEQRTADSGRGDRGGSAHPSRRQGRR
jgi:hypothetical protein